MTGRELGDQRLDARQIIPLEEGRFAQHRRGRELVYRLGRHQIRCDSSMVARLTDQWTDARYDQATSTLCLATYRPTFELVGPDPALVAAGIVTPDRELCLLSKAWVRVAITD